MRARQLPLLLRLVYFMVAGWWVGAAVAFAGWLCCLTIVFLPIGVFLLHRLPLVTTLTMPDEEYAPMKHHREYRVVRETDSVPFVFRAFWFFFVGFWLSLVWIKLAFLIAATFVLTPVAFWMINRVPAILTLEGV